MSEARHGDYPLDPAKQRTLEELRRIQSFQFFKHNTALFDDALQRQTLSAIDAKHKGLKFVDIYTQETSASVPRERALAILLTPDGDWKRPGHPKPHFYVYFSTLESADSFENMHRGLINWVEKVDENGASTLYTITEDGIQPTISEVDDAISMISSNAQNYLTPLETRELIDEVRSFRLAPLEHVAIRQ